MNILSISKKENKAVIEFDSDELVTLCNVLYRATVEDGAHIGHYRLYDGLMLARDLSQYGHIDNFCLDRIVECREKAKELASKNK